MNILFISNDPRESDLLKHELARQAPALHLDASPNAQDAMARLASSAPCDAILLDASVPVADAFNLVVSIRQNKKPIGIVSLVGTTEKTPPLDLFKAGVDNFVLKRAGFVSLLQDALKQAKERHQANSNSHTRQVRLLYAGDIQTIQKHAASLPQMAIEAISFTPDGLLKIPETGTLQDEVVVIDYAGSARQCPERNQGCEPAGSRSPDHTSYGSRGRRNPHPGHACGRFRLHCQNGKLFPETAAHHRAREQAPRTDPRAFGAEITRRASSSDCRDHAGRHYGHRVGRDLSAINRAGLKLMATARLEQIIGKIFPAAAPCGEGKGCALFEHHRKRNRGLHPDRLERSGWNDTGHRASCRTDAP